MAEVDEHMGRTRESVRSILLPLPGDALLLPGAMLAEVLSFGSLQALEEGPAWLLGAMSWRARELPVVDLAADRGKTRPRASGAPEPHKIAVVYALNTGVHLRCYALLCSAVPRPVLASPLCVRPSGVIENTGRHFEGQAVRVDGEQAYIPDVDALERAMLAGLDSWLSFAADGSGVTVS